MIFVAVILVAMMLVLGMVAILPFVVIVMRTLVPITPAARIVSGISCCCDEHRRSDAERRACSPVLLSIIVIVVLREFAVSNTLPNATT